MSQTQRETSAALITIEPTIYFQALAEQTRLRCLLLLAHEGELCVCELTHALRVSQPKMSRHLALLRDAGIVSDRRSGIWIYYRLAPTLPAWAKATIESVAASHHAAAPYADDRERLAAMPDRPEQRCPR